MEIIKQIKEAEITAKNLIEDAQKYAAQMVENAAKLRNDSLTKAHQQRRLVIEQAQKDGQRQGLTESQKLKDNAVLASKQLEQKASENMEIAVNTVIDFLKKQN